MTTTQGVQMSNSTYMIETAGTGRVELTVDQLGEGKPILLLHGGGGPQSVAPFAELLAERGPARVISPVHPGFGGTERPERLTTIAQLAELYVALLSAMGLEEVTVIGNSLGGWIAAEMALLASTAQLDRVVLVDAVGIEVPGHQVVDFFALTMPEVFERSYHEPAKFAIDPATLPPLAQQAMLGNRQALAVYAGDTSMMDPRLAQRLAGVEVPVLVVWGESDRIADPAYGRAFAQAIPGAEFELLSETGHMPQLETPEKLLVAITSFAGRDGGS
jgi:pimeloyl-ACP methyl ester carboxylesterase